MDAKHAPPPPPVEAPPVTARPKRSVFPHLIACVAAIGVFGATIHSANALTIAVNYLALAAIVLSITGVIAELTRRRWAWFAAVPLIVAALGIWYCFDYSYEKWSEINDDGIDVTYQDYTRRSGGWPFYRRAEFTDPSVGGPQYVIMRFTWNGKLHGLRTHNILNPSMPVALRSAGYEADELGFWKATYYWYDEEITEGEWHLRNR